MNRRILPIVAALLALVSAPWASGIEYATFQTSVFGTNSALIPFLDLDGTPDGYIGGNGLPAGSNATRSGTGSFASFGSFTVTGSVGDGALTGDQGAVAGGFWGVDPVTVPGYVVARPSAITVTQAQVEPPFQPFVPAGGVEVMAFKGDVDTVVTFTLDFSTLTGGLLPAGSYLAYTDVDGNETATFAAFDASNTLLSNWLSLTLAGDFSLGNSPGQADPTLADLPTITLAGTAPGLTGAPANTDSPGVILQTLVPIRSLTITAADPDGSSFYQAFAVAVPEPSAAAAILIAAAGFMVRRRR